MGQNYIGMIYMETGDSAVKFFCRTLVSSGPTVDSPSAEKKSKPPQGLQVRFCGQHPLFPAVKFYFL